MAPLVSMVGAERGCSTSSTGIARSGDRRGAAYARLARMRTVLVIGIGAGDPDHLTVEAARALEPGRRRLRRWTRGRTGPTWPRCGARSSPATSSARRGRSWPTDPARELGGPSYRDDVAAWHEQRLAIYERFIGDELADGEAGAFLVWGDPALYDSTLRILDQVRERGRGRVRRSRSCPASAASQVLAARFAPAAARRGRARAHHDGPAAGQGWPDGRRRRRGDAGRHRARSPTVDPAG